MLYLLQLPQMVIDVRAALINRLPRRKTPLERVFASPPEKRQRPDHAEIEYRKHNLPKSAPGKPDQPNYWLQYRDKGSLQLSKPLHVFRPRRP